MSSNIIKHVNNYLPKLMLAIIVMFSSFALAQQSQYLLNPSRADLVQLAEASNVIDAPLALPFVYNKKTLDYHMGVPVSNRIRNGIHGRLLFENGIVDTLADAKNVKHGYEAGTLFLELDAKGNPYLSVHSRNSFISTINKKTVVYNSNGLRANASGISRIKSELFQRISNDYQLPVKKASEELFDKVNSITAKKYTIKFVISYFKNVNTYKLFPNSISPENVSVEQRSSSPELVEAILTERAKIPPVQMLNLKIKPTLTQRLCKAIFKY